MKFGFRIPGMGKKRTVADAAAGSLAGQAFNLENLASRDPRGPPQGAFGIFKRAEAEWPGIETTDGMLEVCRAEWRVVGSRRRELVGEISKTLTTYRDVTVADSCAMALVTEGEQGLFALIQLLDHEHAGIRNMAFLGLGYLDPSSSWAIPLLRRAAETRVGPGKSAIDFALQRVGDSETGPA